LQRLVRIRLTAPWATLEEIADGILYLASDLSSFMTGHALVIDGGESIY
jgi:NAD(P)-dependent dehydrogenase (short-subunit alcohol dehydrogenase family)